MEKKKEEIPEYKFPGITHDDSGVKEDVKLVPVREEDLKKKDKDLAELRKKHDNSRFAIIILSILLIFLIVITYTSTTDLKFMQEKMTGICKFFDYDSHAVYKNILIYCTSMNETTPMLSVFAPYVEIYYQAQKYDVRTYDISYDNCDEDPDLKYFPSKKTIEVTC